MSNLRRAFTDYLQAYARKDLDAIAAMLAEDVYLRDWNLSVRGKTAVLAETAKNFEAARSLDIEILALSENASSVAGELRILVNGEAELFVVDVLDFDAQGRISAIRAYLGRSS